jgi:diaminohydroxyphosphoribosylaminopyrimidine deaminase/5-amino-6-(5-phosphoribosylamino)uracil reductase
MTKARRFSARDRRMMRLALREGQKGSPSPNPHVGAVIARGDTVISVGHHARCGGPHAEVVAIAHAGRRARGATLYVTLEPCNHQGRTGPCAEAIVRAGLRRVVIGCKDPSTHARGALARLRRAGVDVVLGVEATAATRLVRDFAKVTRAGMPLVTLKGAVTLDGRIATRTGDSRWISSEAARREAHRMRARVDAILVGIGTVLADDPELTVRLVRGPQPLRVVLDRDLRTPLGAKLTRTGPSRRTLIVHGPNAPAGRRRALQARGVSLVEVPIAARGGVNLRSALRALARRDVVRLLVEGGARVHGAFLDAGLVDRATVFVAPRIVGDARAVPMAAGRGPARIADAWYVLDPVARRIGPDVLIEGDLARP